MGKILTAVIVATLLVPAAYATDWVKIGGSPTGVTLYYDRDTATYADGHVDAWDRIVFPASQSLATGPDKTVQYAELRGHHNIDCLGRTVVSSEAQFFDAGGNLVHLMRLDAPPTAVAPQSSIWPIAKLYCQNW